ncbi:MAG: hypothetical protein FP833_08150 [Atribacteria sp.]|nr:hypothetical protein [Candidatus Atribacteria bacterium]MBU4046877.1 hypothetical protein [bacterium]
MDELFESVKKRAKELGVKKILIASSSGDSAKRTVRELGTKDYEIIVVTDRAEVVWDVGSMSEKMRREYEIKTGAKEYPNGIDHDSSVRKELQDMGVNWIIQATEVFCKWQVEMHLARKTILHLLERKKWFNPPLLFEF